MRNKFAQKIQIFVHSNTSVQKLQVSLCLQTDPYHTGRDKKLPGDIPQEAFVLSI